MDWVRSLRQGQKPIDDREYEPLYEEPTDLDGDGIEGVQDDLPFSWVEYGLFAWIGMAMLWAWNMFMAAAPYFRTRFESNEWIAENSQSSILSVSTTINLIAMIVLTSIQSTASYPFRINTALVMNITTFTLLAISTLALLGTSPVIYFVFLLSMVACTAFATGLLQNGAFAFAAWFGRPEYMQALMAGQGVAGVLPPIAQITTVLAMPAGQGDENSEETSPGNAAFVYFLTAVIVSAAALLAFMPLIRRHNHIMENRMIDHMAESFHSIEEAERANRKVTSLFRLFTKLRWLAIAMFLCFGVDMFYPVFTAKILSVRHPDGDTGGLLQPLAFVPLGFFFWNLGDLIGRMLTIRPELQCQRPFVLFLASVGRVLFLPLYLLCNLKGEGAVVSSDFFYLFLLQLPFGITNGWLGSNCMMASSVWVEEGEREVAGGFMGLCLVAGLTAGSILSFTVAYL